MLNLSPVVAWIARVCILKAMYCVYVQWRQTYFPNKAIYQLECLQNNCHLCQWPWVSHSLHNQIEPYTVVIRLKLTVILGVLTLYYFYENVHDIILFSNGTCCFRLNVFNWHLFDKIKELIKINTIIFNYQHNFELKINNLKFQGFLYPRWLCCSKLSTKRNEW